MTKLNVKDKLQDECLDLSLCELEEVPVREIAAIKRATHLDLSNNALVSLPKTFVILTQITKLDLSNNMLTEIPENFGELVQLRHLDLYNNNISRLPLSLGKLKNLKWLDLKENPLTPAVASVAGPCSNASECQACARKIVTYLANVQLTVQEEIQRRINAISETEKTVVNKKEGKKKKKSTEKAKAKENSEKGRSSNQKNEIVENNDVKLLNVRGREKPTRKSSTRGGTCSILCRILTFLLLWTVFFAFLIILCIAIFPMYDKQHSEEAFKYLESETGLPIRHYRQLAIQILDQFVNNSIAWTNHIRILAEDYYRRYFHPEVTHPKKVT